MDQNIDEKSAVHGASDGTKGGQFEGNIHISEDVIIELAKKTILGIPNIQPANMGIASKFGIGRKASDGIRVSVEEGKVPAMTVDAYILVKYGQRIPDLAWDVQEKIKANLERYTGYTVSAVNINVQGIYLEEPQTVEPAKEEEKSECGCESEGVSEPEEREKQKEEAI
ncbi:MAG: Asp23/Gls24 family envelope stress response protein [Synergistaceae bacterium]|nr:Asp23/Gls24 family envelope stress response protein [Synergistaceae bacterium]